MSKLVQAAPTAKRNQIYRFIIRKNLDWDPPTSREILGEPHTVKIKDAPNLPPRTVKQRKCQCCECGKVFWRGAHWGNLQELVRSIVARAGQPSR